MADSYTKLLLHLDGTDGSTTITDSSDSGHTRVIVGDSQLDTAKKKFGTASLLLDGSGDYIYFPSNDDFKFGTSDFTVDAWVYPTSFAGEQAILDCLVPSGSGGRTDAFVLVVTATTGKLRLFTNNSYSSSTSGALTLNAWNHVAVSNISGTFKFFIGGTLDSVTATIPSISSGGCVIGVYADSLAGGYFSGQIDEFRISKGIARWTTDFTPPTSAYGDDAGFMTLNTGYWG